jgi:hypothetical protein
LAERQELINKDLKDRLIDIVRSFPGDHCLLCNNQSVSVIGLFVPIDSTLYGGLTTKQRIIRYCLCEKCKTHVPKGRIEEVLIRSTGRGEIPYIQ